MTTRFEGAVQVCAHHVSFSYVLYANQIKDLTPEQEEELHEQLTNEAEERVQTCIIEGCVSGELNCLWIDPSGHDHEVRGWWDIDEEKSDA